MRFFFHCTFGYNVLKQREKKSLPQQLFFLTSFNEQPEKVQSYRMHFFVDSHQKQSCNKQNPWSLTIRRSCWIKCFHFSNFHQIYFLNLINNNGDINILTATVVLMIMIKIQKNNNNNSVDTNDRLIGISVVREIISATNNNEGVIVSSQ